MKARTICKAASPPPTRFSDRKTIGLGRTIKVNGCLLPIPVSLIGTRSLNLLLIGRR